MIVAPVGQYPEGIQGYGHVPGVRGGAIGTFAKIASRYTYRGSKWLARRFFKPKKYTYRGAVGRGIAVGTLIGSQIDEFGEEIDGPIQRPIKTTNRFKQRNRRRRYSTRNRRCQDKYCSCHAG